MFDTNWSLYFCFFWVFILFNLLEMGWTLKDNWLFSQKSIFINLLHNFMTTLSQYSHYESHPAYPFLQTQKPDELYLKLQNCQSAPPHHTPSKAEDTWSGLDGLVANLLQTSWAPTCIFLKKDSLTRRQIRPRSFLFYFGREGGSQRNLGVPVLNLYMELETPSAVIPPNM